MLPTPLERPGQKSCQDSGGWVGGCLLQEARRLQHAAPACPPRTDTALAAAKRTTSLPGCPAYAHNTFGQASKEPILCPVALKWAVALELSEHVSETNGHDPPVT